MAILLFFTWLDENNIKKTTFILDKPVSNSKNLEYLLLKISNDFKVEINIELRYDVDKTLYEKENVITADSLILDKCISWINLYKMIIDEIDNVWKIRLI